MKFREMVSTEINRIGEVNREEWIDAEYVAQPDGSGFGIVTQLQRLEPPRRNPPWGGAGTKQRIKAWKPALDLGGLMYGAFHEQRLVGFVILNPSQRKRSAEIVAFFVDREHRRTGIGARLMQWAEEQCRHWEIEALFLYANPTISSVNFYRKHGFQITGLTAKHIVNDLPGDIVMAKRILTT